MSGEKILIVEDEIIVAMNMEQKLIDLRYNVVGIAVSGEDAVKYASQLKPDLILMDIILKGKIDGINAANQINDILDVPIIYLTAYSDEDVLKRAQKTEPYGYMLKPFRESDVKVQIEMALYKHKSKNKKCESIKRKILADYYDFILAVLSNYAETSQEELKIMLLNILEKRLENDLKPSFDEEMNSQLTDDPNILFNNYLTWLSNLFSSFGIQNMITSDKDVYYIEFLNCPWRSEAKNKPVFCLNCQAIINCSFGWAELEGKMDRKSTIVEKSPSCIFRLK